MRYRIRIMGDAALTLEFPELSGADGAGKIAALSSSLLSDAKTRALPGLIDVLPAPRSLTLCLDPLTSERDRILARVDALLDKAVSRPRPGTQWRLPVCYAEKFGLDVSGVADLTGQSAAQVIAAHSERTYHVLTIGFQPGFPFMGEVADRLHLPRRAAPRLRVPAGSVAIANAQTAIYPWDSPGGWHILGFCPVPLFDPAKQDRPGLLSPGDTVRFAPIEPAELAALQDRLNQGALPLADFILSAGP